MKRLKLLAAAGALSSICLATMPASAEDVFEAAGVAVGVTVGNMWFIPIKAIEVTIGGLAGGLSLALTGNVDLSKQIWQDTTQGPYLITPDVARMAVGKRPELLEKK